MNLRNKLKKFFTLNPRHEAGFTLVELIVVIAILAILGGVGTAAYSGYIKKTNMTADLTLVADVNDAIWLAYYSDSNFVPGVIILSTDEAPRGDEALLNALKANYGDTWEELRLKHNWENTASSDFSDAYNSSSYSGNEESLLNEVGKLTNILSEAIAGYPALVGTGFSSYLTETGLADADSQTKANAAVLYAADLTVNADEEAIRTAFDNYYGSIAKGQTPNVGGLATALKQATGSTFGACAAIYANAEAFCQYASAEAPSLLADFHARTIDVNSEDSEEILNTVAGAFEAVINDATELYGEGKLTCVPRYVTSDYKNDVDAYIASMEAVSNNSDAFTDRLDKVDCYTDGTAANLLIGYIAACEADIRDGEIAIVANVNSDGVLTIVNVPTDYQ